MAYTKVYLLIRPWVGSAGMASHGSMCCSGVHTYICGQWAGWLGAGRSWISPCGFTWHSWLGLLAGVPQFLSMWPFPIASPGFLIRPHEIKKGENGNYMTFCGLGWKSHIVTCTAFCWPKQVTKLGLNQEVGKQLLPIDWRSCKEFVAVFNPPRVGIHYLVNKGQRSHLLVERLQLSRCKLLINH